MSQKKSLGAIFAVFALAAIVAAQPAVNGFQSTTAKDAQSQYLAKINQIEMAAATQMIRIRDDYINALQKAQKDATQQNDLDEAIRIRNELQRLKDMAGGPPDAYKGRDMLKAQLGGTKWIDKPDAFVILNLDGTVNVNGKQTGKWSTIDDHRIILAFDTQNHWCDIWDFDDNLMTFKAVNGALEHESWEGKRSE